MTQPLKLTKENARFIRYEEKLGVQMLETVETLREAQGVEFLCPKCGEHNIICWSRSRGVPDNVRPGPGRWQLIGTVLEDLTLAVDPPNAGNSIKVNAGCAWHGFVVNGFAE